MRFIDFLMFHFTEYFDRNKRLLTWSTPIEKASYALSLMSITWLLTLTEIYKEFEDKDKAIPTNEFAIFAIILGIIISYSLDYIYEKKQRYSYVASDKYKKFKICYKKGVVLSFIFMSFSMIVPFLLAILFHLLDTNHN